MSSAPGEDDVTANAIGRKLGVNVHNHSSQQYAPLGVSSPGPDSMPRAAVSLQDVPLSPLRLPDLLPRDRGQPMAIQSEAERMAEPKFWEKYATMISSCLGNVSTAYNLAVIEYVLEMMEPAYHSWGVEYTSAIASCSLAGAIVGQLSFGYIGDIIGRQKGMVITLALTVLGAVCSAMLTWGDSSVYYLLAGFRFLLGMGVGGVYPLSAAAVAEDKLAGASSSHGSAFRVALTFSFQGWGQLLAPLVALIISLVDLPAQLSFRVVLLVGAVPGCLVLVRDLIPLCRTFLSTNATGTSQSTDQAHQTRGRTVSFKEMLADRENLRKLIGTAGSWFLFDVCFYGNVIFAPTILNDVFSIAQGDIAATAGYSVLLALLALPGYYVSVCCVEKLGNRFIQLQGFIFMSILFAVMGHWYATLKSHGVVLLALYALSFFFSNFGPNSTTFALCIEAFPPEVRGRFNGISAAAGKFGATVGAAMFKPIEVYFGAPAVLYGCCGVCLLGVVVTLCFVDDARKKGTTELHQKHMMRSLGLSSAV